MGDSENVPFSLGTFVELFKARSDCFAVQHRDGPYSPVNVEFREKHVVEHATGERTYGQYLVNPDGDTVKFCCIDNDIDDDSDEPLSNTRVAALREMEILHDLGLRENQTWMEFSGRRGYHVWVFFEQPTNAIYAKKILEYVTNQVDIEGGHTEVFPKQVSVADGGYGNLVKMPLGYHQKSGNKMVFVEPDGEPVDDQSVVLRVAVRNRVTSTEVDGILGELDLDVEKLDEEQAVRSKYRGQDPEEVVEGSWDVRPCIEAAMTGEAGQLTGEEGHNMRVAMGTELLNNGFTVDEAMAFYRQFDNFDPEVTRKKLEGIKQMGHKPWKCSTLKEKCGKYVEGCPCPYRDISAVDSIQMNWNTYGDQMTGEQ